MLSVVIFGTIIAVWTALVLIAVSIARKKHGFTVITALTVSATSLLGVALLSYFTLKPGFYPALAVSIIALETGIFISGKYRCARLITT